MKAGLAKPAFTSHIDKKNEGKHGHVRLHFFIWI